MAASYLTQEEDGTSKFTLEEGGGSLLLEEGGVRSRNGVKAWVMRHRRHCRPSRRFGWLLTLLGG